MRAAVYLRVSLDRTGEGLAVERQQQDCLAMCEARGWQPVIYCDNDTSASTGVRPEYQRLLSDIKAGSIQAVVVWDLDRLHRRPIELEQFMELADEKKIALATVTGDVDLSTDNGRLFARIKGAVAKAEVERKSARQKRALLQRAQAGKGWGTRAFGYTSQDEIVPVEAAAVRAAHESIQAGGTLTGIAAKWNADGLLTAKGSNLWTGHSVRRVLLNPRYAGIREYRGERYPAAWEPIVPEVSWQKTVLVLSNPARGGRNKRFRRGLLTGIAMCGLCNTPLGIGTSGEKKRIRKVYTCKADNCHGIQRDQKRVELFIEDVVVERLSRPDALKLVMRQPNLDTEKLRLEADSLHERRKALALNLAKGLMDENDVSEAVNYIAGRLREIESLLFDATAEKVFDGLIGASDVRAAWLELGLDRQRAIIERLITVTVNPAPRGRGWHPDRIQIGWKSTH